jgi:fucose 4-O-acetylase-like acetyltransferase
MLLQIIARTPSWVFALFALLLWLGGRQLWAQSVSLKRAMLMPLAMAALSIYGVLSTFGHLPFALLGWAATAAAAGGVVLQRPPPAAIRYNAASRSFHVPASATPLVLMMGIFFTKYVAGVQVAMHPALANDTAFALATSTLYGAFSGIFAARALRLLKLAMRGNRASATGPGLGSLTAPEPDCRSHH